MENRQARSHYKIINGVFVPKKSFNTETEALKTAQFLNTKENTIHKMVAYKCSKCEKWHIGSNNTVLTEKKKEKIKNKLNVWHNI